MSLRSMRSGKKTEHGPYKNWRQEQTPFVHTWQKIMFIMVIGSLAAAATSYAISTSYVNDIKKRADTYAYSFDASTIRQLSDTALSDTQVPYEATKKRLTDLKRVYDDTRFVYIMDQQNGTVRFLADSESPDSPDYSARGDAYGDATPLLRTVLSDGVSAVEGPVSDEYGIWYSGLAPIKNAAGEPIALVGVDIPATRYILTSVGVGAGIFIAAIILSVIVFIYDRIRNRRFAALTFQFELMSIASHELRTPLSGIRWGQEVLMKSHLDSNQETIVNAVYDSTLQLQDSIEDILQLTSIGSTKRKQAVKAPVDLDEVIAGTVRVQQLAARTKEIHIVYDESWQKPLPIVGDGTQLRRVFNNILSNAVKYSSIASNITISYQKKDGNHLVVIKNLGMGVPHKELEHIFDGFYRASNAVQAQVNGTGMGLYLSRQTIEEHGGKMWIESVENESTTVYVELPSAEAPTAPTNTTHQE